MVTGEPAPEVSWRRTKGPISGKEKFQIKYDKATGEHILEVSDPKTSQLMQCNNVLKYTSIYLLCEFSLCMW